METTKSTHLNTRFKSPHGAIISPFTFLEKALQFSIAAENRFSAKLRTTSHRTLDDIFNFQHIPTPRNYSPLTLHILTNA
ncbi:hypothetical protein cgR_5056 [Corynebacterium glutamicum R]|uniref:Uncharacterized protein n=1 Tax=Corynebacterium glutamicum (strain R) TaxID=340322 RepID=A0AB72VDP9_CORGB|nr:hypothetical protein cgR_5056 [Corynebacterium glutamicum R]